MVIGRANFVPLLSLRSTSRNALLGLLLLLSPWPQSKAEVPNASSVASEARPQICAPVSYRSQRRVRLTGSRIPLMTDRYTWLNDVNAGWQITHVPLVGYVDGTVLPIPCADDTGLFYIVPLLARSSHKSIDFTIDMFLLGTILAAALVGLLGLWIATRAVWRRAFAIAVVLAVVYLSVRVGDVYSMQAAVVLAFVPWSLFTFQRNYDSQRHYLFAIVAGLSFGLAQWVRTHAGTLVILFLLVLIFGASLTAARKAVLIGLLLASFSIPLLYAKLLVHRRDTYLSGIDHSYHPQPAHHPLWHNLYIGLGYLNNPHVSGYYDVVGTDAVAVVDSHAIYGSNEYELVLKRLVLQIVRKDPYFILYTYAAKLGVVLIILLLSANVGLVASILFPKSLAVEMAFWVAMVFGALPGLIAIPVPQYLTGMIAMAVLYNYVSVCHALDEWEFIRKTRTDAHETRFVHNGDLSLQCHSVQTPVP